MKKERGRYKTSDPRSVALPEYCGIMRFLHNLERHLRRNNDDNLHLLLDDAASVSDFVCKRVKERMFFCCHKDCYTDKVYYFVRGYQFEYKPAPWDVAPCYSDLISAKGRDYAVLQQKFKKVAEKALQRSDKVI